MPAICKILFGILKTRLKQISSGYELSIQGVNAHIFFVSQWGRGGVGRVLKYIQLKSKLTLFLEIIINLRTLIDFILDVIYK